MGNPKNIEPFQFKIGNPGSPGRPKGSRSKLQETVLKALAEDFEIHGPSVIAKVRQRKPEVYLVAMVSLLPKQAQKVESPFADISDAELEALEQHLAVVRAKLVRDIDADPQNNPQPQGRVANTETETPGQSIQNAEPVIMDDATANLDGNTTEHPDGSVLPSGSPCVDGVDDAA